MMTVTAGFIPFPATSCWRRCGQDWPGSDPIDVLCDPVTIRYSDSPADESQNAVERPCDLKATTDSQTEVTAADRQTQKINIHACDSHADLIEWLCPEKKKNGDGVTDAQPVKRYYFGDREIIEAAHQSLDRSCPAKLGPARYTYEPYALLIDKSDPELVQFVQRRVYQLFSDQMRMRALFAAHFPDTRMSPSLAYLFLLNGVDEDRPAAR